MILDIDPKEDYAFKRLLGREATKPILIDVLNQVLGPSHLVTNVHLLNPFNPGDAATDKLSILDIKAKDQSGRLFNVEMQMLFNHFYDKRIVYYAARMHQEQLQEGEDYRNLQPTVSISFLNHKRYLDKPGYHHRFWLLEETQHFPMTNDLEFHILELPKFKKQVHELETGLDMWLYFLCHVEKMDSDDIPTELRAYPLIPFAVEELKLISQSPIEREQYEARRKARMDFTSGMHGAELLGIEKGEKRLLIVDIQRYQKELQLAEIAPDNLLALSSDELMALKENLFRQILSRKP